MRKITIVLAIAFSMLAAMAVPVGAADLHDAHKGTYCPSGYVGTWHFVNNQTGGEQEPGILMASFDNGAYKTFGATKINRNVQHFYVVGMGTILTNAKTDLDGKLVLSDFECTRAKKPS